MRRFATTLVLVGAFFVAGCGSRQNTIVIGSKNFTEQVILAELLAQQIEATTDLHVDRRFYLGGTFICQQAILAGRIDLYPEYSGTALTAILKEQPTGDAAEVYNRVKREYASRFGLALAEPLGFNNTFAMVIRGADARRLGLKTLSGAAAYAPRWRFGCGFEFLDRADGYRGLVRSYGLKFSAPPRSMDLGLLYRALVEGHLDMVSGNSTDGLIPALDLVVLEDDKHYFPPYEAIPVVRQETLDHYPAIGAALKQLAGSIPDEEMRRLNYAVDGEHRDVAKVVRDFLQTRGLARSGGNRKT